MKKLILVLMLISIELASCLEDPKFCYDCLTTRRVSQIGQPTETTETNASYCDKTADEADNIEKQGTSTENVGGGVTVTTTTTCQKQ